MKLTNIDEKNTLENLSKNSSYESLQEVEIKAKIEQEDFIALKNRMLESLEFKFLGELDQTEYYLNNLNSSFFFDSKEGFKDANEYLRIRKTKNGHSVCFKRVHRGETGENLYCDEYEVKIESPEKCLKLFHQLGYTDITVFQKTRNKFLYDDYEIVLDELPEIGFFIEIEYKKQIQDYQKGIKELEIFLEKVLGIRVYSKQSHGYLSMVLNPTYDFALEKKK